MNSAVKPGRVEEITAVSNPKIKWIRSLALKKNREADGLFVAEGMKLATDALEAGWAVHTLVHGKRLLEEERSRDRIQALSATVRARGGHILQVSDKVLSSLTRRDNPQMVVCVLHQKIGTLSDLDLSATKEPYQTVVALDRVRDPGNLGTVIRTCDALGAAGVVLVGETTDPFALETVRATMGSLFHVPLMRADETSFIQFAKSWSASGSRVVGTHLAGSVDHRSIDYAETPCILLMGNEQQGLTDELAECCDQLIRIAMAGEADSLNLAVATGIALFEARRHALLPTNG